jgi:hypothetical protein
VTRQTSGASEDWYRASASPDLPRDGKGLPGYWAVFFGRAAVRDPAGSSSAHEHASEAAAFRASKPLSTGTFGISGLNPAAHPFA